MKKIKLTKEEDKDPKILVKEYKRLEIFITIFMAIAICLGTFYFNIICFGPECENKSPTPLVIINPSKSNNTDKVEENKEEKWTDYLLSQHILEAKIKRVRSIDMGDSENLNKTMTISMDNLKEILSKLENNKLSKVWSSGMGGPDRDHLSVLYEKNDQKYEFEIYYGIISVSKLDSEFKEILDKGKFEEKYIEDSNNPGVFYVYEINNYSALIFDKYFN